MIPILQYLETLADTRGLTRTLGEIEVCRDAQGRMIYSAGNSAAVFKIRCGGRVRSLRCYTRPMSALEEIYGPRLLRRELYVHFTPTQGRWVDVVIDDWIEGRTLAEVVETADAAELRRLSERFDALGADMLADDWAHGDLKPENIIVTPEGDLRLIDFDALFLPGFAGRRSPELGTAAFRHPTRTEEHFDASLDDYPIALISVALRALSLAPALRDTHRFVDGLLIDPRLGDRDPGLAASLHLFESRGEATHYRIARLLAHAVSPRLRGLPGLLSFAAHGAMPCDGVPELFVRDGAWGYRCGEREIVPPLFDSGFRFSEGLAAVQLGRTWHFIDTAGRTRISCSGYEAVKPFRDGYAPARRDGCWERIPHPAADAVEKS